MPVLSYPDEPLSSWPSFGTIGILDLEFTCWQGSLQRDWSLPSEWREIVQIGLVTATAHDFVVTHSFETLVKPTKNPQLSNYFISLTGIEQSAVDTASNFQDAFCLLLENLNSCDRIIFNGADGRVIRENLLINNLDIDTSQLPPSYNFRPLLSRMVNIPECELVSSRLPLLSGLEFPNIAHRALDDCYAIAAALQHWRKLKVI